MIYFLMFFIFSFIGFIIEEIFTFFKTKKIYNRKTMKFLPLCPVYGLSVSFLFMLKPLFGNNKFMYFIFGMIICSIVEYFFNYFFKVAFKIKIWDYSERKLNINGNICVEFSVIWGILSMIVLSFYQEIMETVYYFPDTIIFFLLIYFTVDFFESMYLFKTKDINYIKNYCEVMKKLS